MKVIIGLLKEKNQLLEHFLKLTVEQFDCVENADFTRLQLFYETREGLLNVLKKLDEKLDEQQERTDLEHDSSARGEVQSYLARKEHLIGKILDLDLQIISIVEREKTEVIKELRSVSKGRKVVGAYRSGLKASQG